jgi:hypothetical protein
MTALSWRRFAAILLPALLVLVAVAEAALQGLAPVPYMTRDLAALAHLEPLAGVLSNLGILLWAAAAGICLFVAFSERGKLSPPLARFFLFAGLLTAYLMLDDFFQIHEDLSPRYLHIRERYVYLSIALATAIYLWTNRGVILRSNWTLLALAFVFLGSSAMMDTLLLKIGKDALGDWEFFWEDGFKWLGIVCWNAYHVLAASRRSALEAAVRDEAPIVALLAWLVPARKIGTS